MKTNTHDGMRQIIIFRSNSSRSIQAKVNEWLEGDGRDAELGQILQSQDDDRIIITIFYTLNPNGASTGKALVLPHPADYGSAV